MNDVAVVDGGWAPRRDQLEEASAEKAGQVSENANCFIKGPHDAAGW